MRKGYPFGYPFLFMEYYKSLNKVKINNDRTKGLFNFFFDYLHKKKDLLLF